MSLVSLTIERFADELASDAPAPGGGSVAALAGALASSLAAMVARLTLGRAKYEAAWADMENIRGEADRLRAELLALVDLDTEAYNLVTAAFRLPKDTDEEKAARRAAVAEAFKQAARVPLATLEAVERAVPLVAFVLEKGNPNCVTDAGVAAQLIRAAALGAAYNVRINLGSIKDQAFKTDLAERTDAALGRILAEIVRLETLTDQKIAAAG